MLEIQEYFEMRPTMRTMNRLTQPVRHSRHKPPSMQPQTMKPINFWAKIGPEIVLL
jgi:hypothetical protein